MTGPPIRVGAGADADAGADDRQKEKEKWDLLILFPGCRDIDECRDGLHNCSPPNHICSNTDGNIHHQLTHVFTNMFRHRM